MTFEQARKKLQRIAKGRYFAIEYKLTVYHLTQKRKKQNPWGESKCRLYIDNGIDAYGASWTEAFNNLKISLTPPKNPNLKESPKEELTP